MIVSRAVFVAALFISPIVSAELPHTLFDQSCETHTRYERELKSRVATRISSDGDASLYASESSKAIYFCTGEKIHTGIFFFGFASQEDAQSFYTEIESTLKKEFGNSDLNFNSLPHRIALWMEGDPNQLRYHQIWVFEKMELQLNTTRSDYWGDHTELGTWLVKASFGPRTPDILCEDYGRCEQPDPWLALLKGICSGLLFDACG